MHIEVYVEEIKVRPGYICIEEERIARLDMLDPNNNTSVRFNFQLFKANSKPNQVLMNHIENIQHSLENLIVKDNSAVELELNLPANYILIYERRSNRMSYKVSNSTVLRTSIEDIFTMNEY